MRKQALIILLLVLAASCMAQDTPARLSFPANGFSIETFEGTADSTTYQVLTMYLPPSGDFSPNVSVQVQPYDGTMEDYLALSKQQFEAMKWTLVEEKLVSQTLLQLEYTGTMQNYKLHFYARAEARDGKVYLTTGATTEDQWPNESPRIKKCIDSFRFE